MLDRYRALFAGGEARWLVAASAGARLAIGVFVLPLLLVVEEETGSFAAAGIVSGAFSLGVAAAAPLRGRAVDRLGSRAAMPPLALVSAAALVLVAVFPQTIPASALALVAGAATPPLVAGMRLEWQRVLGAGDPRLAQAYAFESGLQTLVFVVGPLLAAVGLATIGARATLVLSAGLLVAGTQAFARLAEAPPEPREKGARSPIRRPGVLTLVIATALADGGGASAEVAVTAFAESRGRPELAGVLIAVFCVGAIAGVVVYGARTWRLGPAAQLAVLFAVGALATALLALPQTLLLLGVVMLIAGIPSAAQWAGASLALDRASGGRAGAEAYTWLSAANGAGYALGSALGGGAVEAWGTETAFLISALGPALAAVLVVARRATLAAQA